MLKIVKNAVGKALSVAPPQLRTYFKETNEMLFWRMHKAKKGGELYNGHMAYYFTDHFGLSPDYYAGKKVLDVGCGPVGTLEWADGAAERVGLDPLADKYLTLGAKDHKMRYVNSGSEKMPFADGHFDIVTTFNSLDHVEDVDATIAELCRVVRPGGDLLLIVEINHEPTITEPHFLTEKILVDAITAKGFEVADKNVCAIREDHDVYASLKERPALANPDDEAILSIHFRKVLTA